MAVGDSADIAVRSRRTCPDVLHPGEPRLHNMDRHGRGSGLGRTGTGPGSASSSCSFSSIRCSARSFFFRGLLMPRMKASSDVATGSPTPRVVRALPPARALADAGTLVADTFGYVYPSRRYQSTWIGIAVHSSQTLLFGASPSSSAEPRRFDAPPGEIDGAVSRLASQRSYEGRDETSSRSRRKAIRG